MDISKVENVNKGKIVVIKGQSRYNVLRLACDLIAKGFEENGYQVAIIDSLDENMTTQKFIDILIEEMKNNGKFIFSYNALFHNFIIDGKVSLYDQLGYPTLGLLVDHPYHHKERLECSQSDNIYIGVVDHDHVTYINTYYPNLKHVSFLPHFSFQSNSYIPYEKRSIDVYYPGSYKNPKDFNQNLNTLPDVFKKVATSVYKLLLTHSNLTLENALRIYFSSIKFKYNNEDFLEVINLINFVDLWVRSYQRDLIVRTILDAGINLTVSGKGWEPLEEIYKDNLHNVGREGLDIEENIKVIADSKILFNTFPNFKNGTHERIFTAMRNGCVCLTDPSGYTMEHFEDGENIIYYDLDKISEIPSIIQNILNNPIEAKRIAENGLAKASVEYNEKNTSKHILTFMGLE